MSPQTTLDVPTNSMDLVYCIIIVYDSCDTISASTTCWYSTKRLSNVASLS